MHESHWTDDLVERCRKLWADGISASAIAAELGNGITRSAVIGKSHRGRWIRNVASLAKDGRSWKQRRQERYDRNIAAKLVAKRQEQQDQNQGSSAAEAEKRRELVNADQMAALPVLPEQPSLISIWDLRSHHCRWPEWDHAAEMCGDYCGRQAVTGLPYCSEHAKIAYNLTPKIQRMIRNGQTQGRQGLQAPQEAGK